MDKAEKQGLIAQAWATPRYADPQLDTQVLIVRLLAAILEEQMKKP